jgi:hypothetical protein
MRSDGSFVVRWLHNAHVRRISRPLDVHPRQAYPDVGSRDIPMVTVSYMPEVMKRGFTARGVNAGLSSAPWRQLMTLLFCILFRLSITADKLGWLSRHMMLEVRHCHSHMALPPLGRECGPLL